MTIQPYLFFAGRCDEAIAFYRGALGAEVTMLLRFKDSPEPPCGDPDPATAEKIMHCSLRIRDCEIFASDGCDQDSPAHRGFALSLTVPDVAEAERTFAALAVQGEVRAPLTRTFFSPAFGMVADRFGIPWLVVATPEPKSAAPA